jgi:peroxiredoxin Q/BCP
MADEVADVPLPNVAAGPDPFSLSALPGSVDFAVVFLQRDHYCTKCRAQVQRLADRVDDFKTRNAEVVAIVPEPTERVESWQASYDLPYPLLADPEAEAGEAYDQPVRFGLLGQVSDFVGRMPAVAIVDRRGDAPTLASVHRGSTTGDRPAIDDLLAELDDLRSEG